MVKTWYLDDITNSGILSTNQRKDAKKTIEGIAKVFKYRAY
jgi:hypothetical protein